MLTCQSLRMLPHLSSRSSRYIAYSPGNLWSSAKLPTARLRSRLFCNSSTRKMATFQCWRKRPSHTSLTIMAQLRGHFRAYTPITRSFPRLRPPRRRSRDSMGLQIKGERQDLQKKRGPRSSKSRNVQSGHVLERPCSTLPSRRRGPEACDRRVHGQSAPSLGRKPARRPRWSCESANSSLCGTG